MLDLGRGQVKAVPGGPAGILKLGPREGNLLFPPVLGPNLLPLSKFPAPTYRPAPWPGGLLSRLPEPCHIGIDKPTEQKSKLRLRMGGHLPSSECVKWEPGPCGCWEEGTAGHGPSVCVPVHPPRLSVHLGWN